MTLIEYAKQELERAGLFDKDSDYDGMLGEDVMELIEVFSKQGHSGFSAARVVEIFGRLALYQPLLPLTGEDDEWEEVGDGTFQNKRCSRVFKENGQAYDINGKVFVPPNGSAYVGKGSHVPITFPYYPKTEYVRVEE